MRIGIIGVGGVGGFYGGKLALKHAGRRGHEVIFYTRGAHLEAIRKDGLKLVTVDGEYTVRPMQATDNPAEMGPLDLAIFCTKSYGLEDAARAVAGNLGAESVVLPLLNGVDITDRLRAVLSRGEVLYGGVFISSAIQGPGVVKQAGGTGQLFFGPANRTDVEKYRPIEALLRDAGIKAELSADPLLPLWTKYIFIGPMAGVTSLTGKPFGGVLADADDRALIEGMMKEIEAVARGKGVHFPPDIVEASLGKAAAFAPSTKTSMQLDYERGNRTELDIFTAYMVRAGKELGIPVPLHRKVYAELMMRG
ncbi:MAG: 2-dehydropantoate 2-reductase [Syntrophales bacterium]|jgi:2-dehydropantoate 2-reductase|nr:2-dehydropantoate 2-reductase [Syntrophales bacterium]